MTLDPVSVTQDLIRCPSVTPDDAGALAVLEAALTGLGFTCERLPFSEPGTPDIDNLYARIGTQAPHFCFAGHTDVVPVGKGWTVDPFKAEIIDGVLYGRGAADMKGGIGCFVAAVSRFLDAHKDFQGSISFLITGDEEGPSINGTRKMLEALDARGEKFDHCLVGEPTNPLRLGDMLKVGRRGSINSKVTVFGTQGHAAYPHRADNPISRAVKMVAALESQAPDNGTEFFQPSTLAVTTFDVGNPATNVIPGTAEFGFNIRFNDTYTAETIKDWIKARLDSVGGDYDIAFEVSGESFITQPETLAHLIADAAEAVTGNRPEFSTSGGTSDARFIKNYCRVAEFGLVGESMHKADERAAIADIEALTDIYERVLNGYFSG